MNSHRLKAKYNIDDVHNIETLVDTMKKNR